MKILILITAFNVNKFLENVINRIPKSTFNKDVEILIIDDKSSDNTVEKMIEIQKKFKEAKINLLSNKINLGYGGNQKVGYQYAINNDFSYVILLHGDGQYAPEKIPDMLDQLIKGNDAVQGSRMINKIDALKGRMPFYKFLGNIGLTFIQNKLTGLKLSEFHSGYRGYAVKSLKKIPFHLNSSYYEFDSEILIQMKLKKLKIVEIPIPTFYGDEISYLNSFKYGFRILKTTLISYLNRYKIFYERKYDIDSQILKQNNNSNTSFESTHKFTIDEITNNTKVLDIYCHTGIIGKELINKKNCNVVGIDKTKMKGTEQLNKFILCDLDSKNLPKNLSDFNYILLLDAIEHIKNPEIFMDHLYERINFYNSQVILSTPNVAHIIIRLMLMFGKFNYGKSGILNKSHTRLFTRASIEKLIEHSNFKIVKSKGIPIPFPLVVKNKLLANFLLNLNSFLIKLQKNLFSFQFIYVLETNPDINFLLNNVALKVKSNEKLK